MRFLLNLKVALIYRNTMRPYKPSIIWCFSVGGATRRPGTFFAGRSKDGGKVRLINFEFSDEQAYVLEFGANYVVFIKMAGY